MMVTKTRVGPCSQLLIWTDHLFQWNSSAEWLRVFNQISYWSWVSTSTVEKPIEERGSLRRASWDALGGDSGPHRQMSWPESRLFPRLPSAYRRTGSHDLSSSSYSTRVWWVEHRKQAHTSGQIWLRALSKSLQFSVSQQERAEA